MNERSHDNEIPGDLNKRADYYLEQARIFGQTHEGFHWPSLRLQLNLIYTYGLLNSHFARFSARYGLSPSAFNLMMILHRSENHRCALHEISDLMLVSRANITGLVDSLERKGLVERISCRADRRVKFALLTKAGSDLMGSLLPKHYQRVHDMFAPLGEEKIEALDKMLGELRQILEKWDEDLAHSDKNRQPPTA